VHRIRAVLENRVVRMLEASRLVRDVSKPRVGQAVTLAARHVRAMRSIPHVLSGRKFVDMSAYGQQQKRRRRAKKGAEEEAASTEEPQEQ
jgi:hypothetical protein